MAASLSTTTNSGDHYNGRITSFVVLSCVMASMGGVIFGYDIGISGGVTLMGPFLKKFFPDVYARMRADSNVSNYCKFESQLLSIFTSSLYIAGLVASFFAASVTRAFGRRTSILIGGAAFLSGAALGGAAVDMYMLILGRVLLGVGVGFANQSVPLYLSEMAPPQYRGAFNNGFQFSVGIGILSANLINYGTAKISGGWGWRLSLALAAVPASALALGTLPLPETPNSLVQCGREDDLHRATILLRKIRGTPDVGAEIEDLVSACTTSKSSRRPFRDLMRRRYRPQLVMAFAITFFQQVTGINAIVFYAPLLFRMLGLGESASLMSSIVTGLVNTTSAFLSMLAVDRLGRRTLFIAGGLQMLASQLVVGAVLAARLGDDPLELLGKGWAFAVLVAVCTYVAGFGWSLGPLGWLVPSEIFPLEVRSAGQSVSVAVNFFFTFAVAQTFLAMLCHMKAWIFFFSAGWVAVMTGFVYVFLPETKDVPMERMERVWGEHWFWRRFVEGQESGSGGGADGVMNTMIH